MTRVNGSSVGLDVGFCVGELVAFTVGLLDRMADGAFVSFVLVVGVVEGMFVGDVVVMVGALEETKEVGTEEVAFSDTETVGVVTNVVGCVFVIVVGLAEGKLVVFVVEVSSVVLLLAMTKEGLVVGIQDG